MSSSEKIKMIEYTREEALNFFNEFIGGTIEGDNTNDTLSPKEIIFRAINVCSALIECFDNHTHISVENCIFKKSLEEMPLLINEKYPINKIAKWRLSVAK